MTEGERQQITFLDEEGNELTPDEVGADGGSDRAYRRRARVEQYLPDGGGAAIAALVFVLVTWLGATPLVQAVSALFPQGAHTIGDATDAASQFGNGQYFGITPGLIPVITYGTRALLAVLALVLAFRARHREHSALATAAVATASLTLLLMIAGGVLMAVGLALGNGTGVYGTPY